MHSGRFGNLPIQPIPVEGDGRFASAITIAATKCDMSHSATNAPTDGWFPTVRLHVINASAGLRNRVMITLNATARLLQIEGKRNGVSSLGCPRAGEISSAFGPSQRGQNG